MDDRSKSTGLLKPSSSMHDGYCTSPLQSHRKKDTLSSTEEEDTSGPSDLEYQTLAQRSVPRRVERPATTAAATPERASDTIYRKSRLCSRRKEVPPSRHEASCHGMTLDKCPSILLSFRSSLNERLQTLRFIERELAHAFQDSDPLQLVLHSILDRNLHVPLLATLRTEAVGLLRNTPTSNVQSLDASIKLLDNLLGILQGICLIGLRRNKSFEAEEGTARNIREALGQEWVVEALIDLLSWSKSIPPPASPTHQILNTLFTILVYIPSTLPAFSAAGGYEVIAGLLKLVDEKQVKVKAIEFFVYLGSLATNEIENDERKRPVNAADKEEDVDVFGTPKPISVVPATPSSSQRTTQSSSRHIFSEYGCGRTPSAQSSSSTATNQADTDLLRTPLVSENESDVEVWLEDGERRPSDDRRLGQKTPSSRNKQEAFRFPMSLSSSALSPHGFYTPQQRAEKHRPSYESTSGSSQEGSAISETAGLPSLNLRRSSLSIRPSTSHQRIPSLRSLARVEEELSLTPKKLVDMSPARLKADFRDSEVHDDMRSTIRLRVPPRPSSNLRSPRTPATDRKSRAKDSSAETCSANPSPTRDSSRDSSKAVREGLGASRSTDPRLLIPSAKANIGLGFPRNRGDMSTPQATKSRTGSAEYPRELAQDPRIRSGISPEKVAHQQPSRTSSNDSTSSLLGGGSGSKGIRKSHTATQLADVVSSRLIAPPSANNTIRLCRSSLSGADE
ncbi:hypothetical protein QFC22_001701 [Naganishia vaughanmartiniae]|uniref:Uncharacterized protein n=1 Tax=Naganishia vaughanmartiniae TaxID=1424756 RepID=A0ACC2XFX0_9TREE|nr:hypothetical protein QFC22_001701 [Naganishia vaughanmartiniae]